MTHLISGGGGGGKKGGGGGGTPTTAGDNLNSTQFAQLIDLISEGEIEGLKDGLKSIYINNTPLQNQDNSYNFQNVTVEARNGRQDQSFIPFLDAIEDEIGVGIAVSNSLPVIRTITDSNVDAVRITLTFSQFQEIKQDGDILGTTVDFAVAVQYNGGGFTTVVTDTITGRSGDQYQRDYVIPLAGARPTEIRVTRITPDSTSSLLVNEFTWSSYTELIYAKLRYPNSALVALRVDAQQFSNIPTRTYLVRGIKVKIPDNATVNSTTGSLTYAGIWTGTFGAAHWCSDPAWVLWDLLTSKRYGLGDHLDVAQLDKWAFYSASQYASALNTYTDPAEIAARTAKNLPPRTGTTNDYHATTGRHGVPDGFGGYEPRFSCNVNIQTAEEAYKLINDMCSVFRVMPYWSVGALTVNQDKPADPAYLFTLANVSEAGFTYQSSGQKIRPTVAVVSYLDLSIRDIAYEVVEDTAAIAKYGVTTAQISAFACTSRGQASRIGEWLLYSEQYEAEVISFTTSVDAGVLVRPGQIIEVADPMRAGSRRGGRVVSAITTAITVDNATDLPASGGTVSVILPDGTVESRAMTTRTGTVLSVNPAFTTAPGANSVWIYQSTGLEASTWRVLAVQEQDGIQYVINALAYNSSKYDYIERDKPLQQQDVTNLNELLPAPTSLTISEALYTYQDSVRAKVITSWPYVKGANEYQVRWRKDNGNWTSVNKQAPDYEILNITPGFFEFEIYSINAAGKLSVVPRTGNINALGKTAPPSTVSGFGYILDPSLGVTLTWNPVPDIDLADYEIRRGVDWDTGVFVSKVKASSYKIGYLDDGTYTYFIRALDTSNVYSETPVSTSIVVTPPGASVVTHQILGETAVIQWTSTNGSYLPSYYEVRYGASFAAGISLGQFKTTSASVPITWSGVRTFWVAAVDPVGNTGTAGSTSVENVAAPAPNIAYVFGSDSVRLSWLEVNGSVRTKTYEIRRGTTFASATVIGSIQATSLSIKVDWVGAQTFWVVPIDSNNNVGTEGSVVVTVLAAATPTVNSAFSGDQVILSWEAIKGSLDTAFYEIRRGSTYSTALIIGTIQGTTYTVKVNWAQTERFWVSAFDVAGNIGSADSIDVVVPPPSEPSITSQVVDNNVLLKWTDSTTVLPVVYYELRRGSVWATASVIGTKQGLFTSVFETVSGDFTYWLAAIDSAGNVGTPGFITTSVNQPPDYILQLDQNSTWAGTETNVYTDTALGQIVNVNTTETWQSHFTSNGYNSPQDQITAGFAYYLMPSTITAAYEEEFDYGTVLASTKVSATLTSIVVAGSTTIVPTLRVRGITSTAATYSQTTTTITVTSTAHGLLAGNYVFLDFTSGTATDGTYVVATAVADSFTVTAPSATTSGNVSWVKWVSYPGIEEVFSTNFRYFRVRYDFTSAGNNDLLLLTNLNVRLDSKLRSDAGSGTANSGDSGGTTVNFTVAFVDIQSISVTPLATTGVIAVYDFVDVPNPTSFKVLLFNTSGTRVSGGFSWSARGV